MLSYRREAGYYMIRRRPRHKENERNCLPEALPLFTGSMAFPQSIWCQNGKYGSRNSPWKRQPRHARPQNFDIIAVCFVGSKQPALVREGKSRISTLSNRNLVIRCFSTLISRVRSFQVLRMARYYGGRVCSSTVSQWVLKERERELHSVVAGLVGFSTFKRGESTTN